MDETGPFFNFNLLFNFIAYFSLSKNMHRCISPALLRKKKWSPSHGTGDYGEQYNRYGGESTQLFDHDYGRNRNGNANVDTNRVSYKQAQGLRNTVYRGRQPTLPHLEALGTHVEHAIEQAHHLMDASSKPRAQPIPPAIEEEEEEASDHPHIHVVYG